MSGVMLFILLFMCSVDAKAWPVTVIRGAGLLAAGQDAAHGFFDGEASRALGGQLFLRKAQAALGL